MRSSLDLDTDKLLRTGGSYMKEIIVDLTADDGDRLNVTVHGNGVVGIHNLSRLGVALHLTINQADDLAGKLAVALKGA